MLSQKEWFILAEAEREEDKRLALASFAYFVKQAWPTIEPNHPFVPGWHIDAICDHLQAVYEGKIRNLLINIPPRHAKSTIVSVLFPAWVWLKEAHKKFIYSSHSHTLSIRDSLKCRILISSMWYRTTFKPHWVLNGIQTQNHFQNSETGSRMASSVGGSIIGQGGDCLVVDDPHSPTESYSEPIREGVLRWYDEEFSIRVNDPKTTSKIIIMQRLHEGDLSGHVLEKGNWEHLCLPAEFELSQKKMTCIGWEDPRIEEGEPLWPSRFGKKEIQEFRHSIGSRGSAGQLQQRPAVADGDIAKRSWWKTYTVVPAKFDFVALSCDLTFKETKKGAYNALQVWGRIQADKYLLFQIRERLSFNDQLKKIEIIRAKYPRLNAVWIEDAANAQAMLDVLKSKVPGLILIPADESKLARAEAVSPQIEAGNIYLPHPSICDLNEQGDPWIEDFIEEWAVCPNGKYWDQVDASSMAITELTQAKVPIFMPMGQTKTSTWLGR